MNTLIVVINDGAKGAEDVKEKKSFTAKDAEVAKKTLIRFQLQERRGIAKGGIEKTNQVIHSPFAIVFSPPMDADERRFNTVYF